MSLHVKDSDVNEFKAGSLSKKYKIWERFTNDKWILNAIQGLKIEFFSFEKIIIYDL